jgi:hypothetical protein
MPAACKTAADINIFSALYHKFISVFDGSTIMKQALTTLGKDELEKIFQVSDIRPKITC